VLIELIFYDMQDVFRVTKKSIAGGDNLSNLKEQLKSAYLDYLIVSPEAKKIDFGLDREIRKGFTELLTGRLALAAESTDPGIIEKDIATLEDCYRRIFGI
jgi:hypothetical protein